MATLVAFHAHPDDEAIGTGGTLAKASAEGHRVVVVFATGGELGEPPPGGPGPGEALATVRAAEAAASAAILGVHRVAYLGYRDSGMAGSAGNDDPACFWRADVEEAAIRLAAIITEEQADVLTTYDDHGVTGHPDHVQVHRVGGRAADLTGTRCYEGTLDRDRVVRAVAVAMVAGDVADLPRVDVARLGSPWSAITTTVEVGAYLDHKRRAMAAHASQVAETSMFLALPPRAFADLWGHECFIRRGAPPGTCESSLFDGL